MIVVALSPKARALIQAHREAGRPTAADRQRVAAALRARVGSVALPLERPIRGGLLSSVGQRRSATALGVCVVGSVLFLARRPSTPVGPATQLRNKSAQAVLASSATAVSSEPAASIEAPVPASIEAPTPALHKADSTAPRPPAPKVRAAAAQDTLAQEVLLLSSAATQLRSGQAAGALLTLDEHQRRFSNGVLGEERNAAKARAFCQLHRFSEGRATLALLAPGSPIAARVKEDCDSASPQTERPAPSRNTGRD